MGIVREQAVKNSIISYAGVVLGYINIIILFPAFFTTEQFGLIQLLVQISFIYSQLSAVGLITGINRYFPYFKTDDKKHNEFLSYVLFLSTSGFIITSILYFVFRGPIIGAYIDNSKLFTDYFYTLLPLAFFSLLFNILEALVRVVFKTVFATLLKEVVLRLLTIVGIILYISKIFSFEYFIYYYVATYLIVSMLLFFQFVHSREYVLKISFLKIKLEKLLDILKYGIYNLLAGAAMFVGQKIDIIMIGSMIGLSIVGVYSLYLYIASIIYIPMKAMSRISVPIVANAWKENDIPKIIDIYNKTSLIQLIIGLLLYVGVIINKHNLFLLLKKPEYTDNFGIFYFVGIAILLDVSVGLNSEIIAASSKYKVDAYANIVLFVTSIIMNLIFIPIWGGIGAAAALIITFFVFNLIKSLYLLIKYKMNPVSSRQFVAVIIAVICYFIGDNIPIINNLYLDIFVRSSITSIIFLALVYFTKISVEINQRVVIYKDYFFNKVFIRKK
ncbi:MAG TPA: polysaccharide biosynthesis C-terminal domain-containing protein [Ignavibacteria bacterium]|nr:polysaccharide biosynthesis C-terminal domain-containing protein [Ignavibacteria bacterium]